ncbi:restriction endonuclease [Alloalcanivorax gelatiniphagus]|uniref:Restriction endonuclease n=2 Tax=Alloalcanivorax gelatiniphagus TaxID=1194167 RepID=A0ABY2XNL4_9GAMM|nr:restriction endonuclease [Alloalcanivorax gelatiniphagus]|tara:strand:- start:936 stop:2054 length:1119 start_codon:yes stop_codon:yes gene_type:complete
MDFEDRLEQMRAKVGQLAGELSTEEATKNALVMPFIKDILGYDVFNPLEVIPEFTADQGIKKGEKVDYAVKQNGLVQILIECKRAGDELGFKHASQLYRYFSVTDARIAILTNGVRYQFFTDLDAANRMDKNPFMEIDFANFNWRLSDEIRKLSKNDFDLGDVINAAGELKYTNRIKKLVAEQFSNPSEEFVTLFASQVYDGRLTQRTKEDFREIVRKATAQFLNDNLNDRLKGAVRDDYTQRPEPSMRDGSDEEQGPQVETTAEELQGFYIVRAILSDHVDINRIIDRDTLSYFGVLLDDNNRKPICRLHFNRAQKYLGLFDENKKETRHPISAPTDIFQYKDQIRHTIGYYDTAPATTMEPLDRDETTQV